MANLGLEVWGDYAFFKRPEKKGEMVSYDFLTPLAAKGVFEALYWHPGVHYVFDEIRVLSPVQYEPVVIRRTDSWTGKETVMKFLALTHVHYLILGHCMFDGTQRVNASVGKTKNIFMQRAKKQKAFKTTYFGLPEFTCQYKWVDPASDLSKFKPINRTCDLGLMIYDLRNDDGRVLPEWFHASIQQGIIPLKRIKIESGRGSRIVNKGTGDYT